MHEVTLRSAAMDDLDALVEISERQDRGWWDESDTDADDIRVGLERAVATAGSLDAGSRVALVDGVPVGFVVLSGHGQVGLFADPTSPDPSTVLGQLVDWAITAGATEFDSPVEDRDRMACLADRGFEPSRSSFELERSAVLDDVPRVGWPAGIETARFDPDVDAQNVHDMIYSVWTDVPGHTHRPIDEWRALFIDVPSFDPDLVVLTRRVDTTGAVAGIAVCRTFPGSMGWVTQLAVGRPDRGIGLGRALLVEALHRLAATGVERLGLGVEADNPTALGLYRSVGLEVDREWVHVERHASSGTT